MNGGGIPGGKPLGGIPGGKPGGRKGGGKNGGMGPAHAYMVSEKRGEHETNYLFLRIREFFDQSSVG